MPSGSQNHVGSPARSVILALDRWATRLTSFMAHIGIVALIVAIVVVVSDIIWRRIGGRSFIGAVDLTQFSVVAAAAWSIPFAFSVRAHVTVDLLGKRVGPALGRILELAAWILSAAILAFVLWLSWHRAMEVWGYGDVSQDLAIPMIYYWAFFLSGLLVSVLVCLIQAAKTLIAGKESAYDA